MKKITLLITITLFWLIPVIVHGFPTVYPTGTTIYKPEKCWNGFTVVNVMPGYVVSGVETSHLIDMNGNVVKAWAGIYGFPTKILPGGFVMGTTGTRPGPYQDCFDLVQVDWSGNIVWKFDRTEEIKDSGKPAQWMARMHHDFQREGNPVGYYVPGMNPKVDRGNTLILSHKNLVNPKISEKLLHDDYIIEVTWDGKIGWDWLASAHFDEMGFDEAAKNTMYRNPGWSAARGAGDWAHINSMSYLGPNKWYDAGDQRFHPDNIIVDARETNIIWIIDKKTGKIVWKVGPDYTATPELRKLGQIIGQHHAHMIPKGLPGAGNILVFDNGGAAGYGNPNPGSPTGRNNALNDFSRVIEFNPITLEKVWEYTALIAGYRDRLKFYSHYISSAQRLPNGNTLITEGADGRLFEVNPNLEIVWEYMNPFFSTEKPIHNMVYRAYRVPYEWVPQLPKPAEKAVIPPPNSKLRLSDLVAK